MKRFSNLEVCQAYFPSLDWKILGQNGANEGDYEGSLKGLPHSLRVSVRENGCRAWLLDKGTVGGGYQMLESNSNTETDWSIEKALIRIRILWKKLNRLNAIAIKGGLGCTGVNC